MSSCVVPGCKSGYGTSGQLSPGVSRHRFPKDPVKRDEWIKAIPRANWQPSKRSVICSLHFEDSDFRTERHDSNTHRDRGELKTRHLKATAIPRVFPNLRCMCNFKTFLSFSMFSNFFFVGLSGFWIWTVSS